MSLLVSLLNPSSGGSSNDKGYFVDQAALEAAYPVGQAGWYAVVGSTDTIWIWDTDTNAWVDSGFSTMGTVTNVSVATANGFAGSVANPTTTPELTLSTTITGILQGNGSAISAASTTGTGAVVLANSPTLVTPNIGVATATSLTSGSVLVPSYGLGIADTGSTGNRLLIACTESLGSNRNLDFIVNSNNRLINLSGDIVIAANFTTSGANSLTLTTTASTNVTLPTTGTLSTLAGAETLTNKTLIDNSTYFASWSDATKRAELICDDISSGATRIFGFQDQNGSLALLQNTLDQFANTSASNLAAKLTGASDGQLFIGKTDGSFVPATLTEGSNITITNGDGAITIAASPSPARPTYYSFSSTTLVTVTHNLGYKPIVQVMDDTGEMITDGVDIDHVSDNQFTIASDLEISGTAMYLGGSSGTPAEYTFTSSTLVTVTHNLGYKPIIQVLDASGEMITDGVDIDHVSNDEFTVASLIAISGTILYL